MRSITNRIGDRVLNVLNFLLGIALAVSPWLLGFDGQFFAAWSAWIFGSVIGLMGLLAINQTFEWEEWFNLILGPWAAAAPWMLGFSETPGAMWTHVVVGSSVALLAAMELWRVYHVREVPYP
jgi:hypothetical protein